MGLAEGIRRVGFRRWYERQLIECHFYLVSAFLSLVMVIACIEGFSLQAPGVEPLLRLAGMIGGGVLCLGALARYQAILDAAEYAAERSVCAKCATYGILELSGTPAAAAQRGAGAAALPLGVRCRRCGHEWVIE
jgi:hypothetical protein